MYNNVLSLTKQRTCTKILYSSFDRACN